MWRQRLCSLLGTPVVQGSVLPAFVFQCSRWKGQLASSVKVGQTIELKGKLFTVLKATHQKGTARQIGHVQLELRDVKTQLKHNERLRSSEDVEVAFLTSQKWNVLCTEKDTVTCIHPETYDQISVPLSIFGRQSGFVWSGMEVTVESHNDEPVVASLPLIVEMTVDSIEDEIHDNMRNATLANGRILKLPTFVKQGDTITLNTKDGTFLKRSKS